MRRPHQPHTVVFTVELVTACGARIGRLRPVWRGGGSAPGRVSPALRGMPSARPVPTGGFGLQPGRSAEGYKAMDTSLALKVILDILHG
jgi:hypothetical protein